MSTKSFDILWLCGTGWSWVGRAQSCSSPAGSGLVWDECSAPCRQRKGQHPGNGHVCGKEDLGIPSRHTPHIHKWELFSKLAFLARQRMAKSNNRSRQPESDNSFCLLLFHLPWLLLPISDVCRCARDVQDKGPALLLVSCSTPGSRKRQSLWPLQEGVGWKWLFWRKGEKITGGRVKAHS